MKIKYRWKNLDTGGNGVRAFNGTHHWYFSESEILMHGVKPMLAEAERIIQHWNKVHPKTWQYELIGATLNDSIDLDR